MLLKTKWNIYHLINVDIENDVQFSSENDHVTSYEKNDDAIMS